jgi:predicted  nucleic acid-binding Zn-ribbon protein
MRMRIRKGKAWKESLKMNQPKDSIPSALEGAKRKYPEEMLLMNGCANCGQEVNTKFVEDVIDRIAKQAREEGFKAGLEENCDVRIAHKARAELKAEILAKIKEQARPYDGSKWFNTISVKEIEKLLE